MKDMSDCNKNNNQDVNLKEEKLFRAMSGVDEDLLLRSEQIRNSGRVHKFPMRYVTRIAAACLCFVVAGVLYMTMSSTKMADSTGNADTAAPQMAYGITEDQEIQEEAVDAARSGDTAGAENETQKEAAMAAYKEKLDDFIPRCQNPQIYVAPIGELDEKTTTGNWLHFIG